MSLSIALALLGTISGFAAVLVLVVRYGGSRSNQLSLAQSASARLKELERTGSGAGLDAASADEARIELLRELLDAARSGQSQWWLVRGDRGALATIGLTALAMGCFSLLTVIDKAAANGLCPHSWPRHLARPRPRAARALREFQSTRAHGRSAPMSTPQGLPDVETMIERLAARLQTAPEDADGWRMLGWSYLPCSASVKGCRSIRAGGRSAAAVARAQERLWRSTSSCRGRHRDAKSPRDVQCRART